MGVGLPYMPAHMRIDLVFTYDRPENDSPIFTIIVYVILVIYLATVERAEPASPERQGADGD